ncbi:hypothetical protein SCHPADRAFT_903970 [Schizopora paradoxa]|uniref:Uncharacterized protein n=1 Tax=Schizopora paradoxa TaxID=27342 RepID=A0A0H2RW26_9AGAM|nr:hypothetical protein SCHPADRAFT_903970 [Schizopora paradoxa]
MAYGVTSQKFLCCFPVRIGVFLLSLLELVSAAAVAGLLWFGIVSKQINVAGREKIAVIVVAVIMSIVAIVCLCGFIGSVIRSRRLVSIYSTALNWLLGLSVLSGIAYIVLMFTMSKSKFIDTCINGSTDQNIKDECQHVNEIRFIAVGWLVFNWIIHLYMCIIVNRYVRQLEEEDSEKYRLKSMHSNAVYQRTSNRDSMEALTYPRNSQYPYSDGKHSFGSHV